VPVLASAAVLTVWLALRPALTPTQTSEVTGTAAPAPANPNAATAAPPQNEIAQAQIPPPPAAATPALKKHEPSSQADRENARDLDQLKPRVEKEAPRTLAAAQSPSASPEHQADANPSSAAAAIRAAAAPASALPAPAAPRPSRPGVTVTTEIPVLGAERTAPSANTTSPVRSAGPVAEKAGAAGTPLLLSDETVAGLAKEVAPGVTFAAVGGPMWRVGPGGHIERSGDKGATWQPQSSGVTADLLAGFAVSGQIAWVVGRDGVILRTTDGELWQRVASPNRLMVDWTNIQATDGQRASIKSSDNRSFRTEDGGKTWTTQ
jgi:hypothetical protein